MSALAECDDGYHAYLYSILNFDGRACNHTVVIEEMACCEFVVYHPLDGNRIDDAQRMLRNCYIEDEIVGPCTILEILIVVCKRLCEEIGSDIFGVTWLDIFWDALLNCGLYLLDDDLCKDDREMRYLIQEILHRIIVRDYSYNGRGGFWPLVNPRDDARNNDLARQLNLYFTEHFTFDD